MKTTILMLDINYTNPPAHSTRSKIMASYSYIEDNAGGLFLFITDDTGAIVAGIQDLEHAQPGEWLDVADDLNADPITAIRTWDGQIEDPSCAYDNMMGYYGCEIVCFNGLLHPFRMGRAAQRYFGIDSE